MEARVPLAVTNGRTGRLREASQLRSFSVIATREIAH